MVVKEMDEKSMNMKVEAAVAEASIIIKDQTNQR